MGFRQDFVVATSLQAKPVVLDSISALENKIFGQAVSEAVDESAQTVPLSLISVASDWSSAPTYQSSAQLPSGANSLKYSTNAWFGGPSDQQIDLPTSIDASELSIF